MPNYQAMTRGRILVIDDEEAVRTTLRNMLEDADYDVLEAADGEEGLRLFETERAALVLTDILMPRMEGNETIAEFRRRYPDVKIIAMSGGGATGNMDFLSVSKKLGADGVLVKPVDLDRLISTVGKVLEGTG